MKKKKILVVLGTNPEVGGQHQYALTLMESILEINDIEIIAICSNRYWKKWCKENGIRVLDATWYSFTEKEQKYHLKYSLFSRIYCMYISELGRILCKEKVDAVIGTMQGLFVPNLNIKMIVPIHDLMHRYERQFPEIQWRYEALERVFSSNAKYAWCALVDSKIGMQQFKESYSAYMRKRMPHIVRLQYVVPKHIAMCEEEFIDVPSKYVFYPAQFWQHKNHLNLIKAIQILIDEIPDIHLVLVGSEKNSMKWVRRYITENELDSYVTIKGFVSNGNMTYLYKHAVGMVMPSYFGPTNIPPLEAMALGCPVAVSNKYAMPEQVGKAGLLFNPDSPLEMAKCIKKMWCDEKMRQQMVVKGYARIDRWTVNEFREKIQKIIQRI